MREPNTEIALPKGLGARMISKEKGGLTFLADNIKHMGQLRGATLEVALGETRSGTLILVGAVNSGADKLTTEQINKLADFGINYAAQHAKGMRNAPHAEENIGAWMEENRIRGIRWSKALVGGKPRSYICRQCRSIIELMGGEIEEGDLDIGQN